MKGVIVFNNLNDVVYIYADEFFKAFLQSKAKDADLIGEDVSEEIDPNVVMQLFSPLVASRRFMASHVKDPYHCIEIEDNTKYVFEQYHDYVLLAVGEKESTNVLHRKLLIMQRIIGFLFGPVTEEIRPPVLGQRDKRWAYITQLLDTWTHLYHEEQSFLVEAVERLQVNQMLNARAVEVLESVMSTMKSSGDRHCVHALLAVNSKLLALYSSRNAQELQASDILMMILSGQTLYPTSQRLEDMFSQTYFNKNRSASSSSFRPGSTAQTPDTEKYESASEGPEDGSDNVEQYSTPRGSPRISPSLPTATPNKDSFEEYFGSSVDLGGITETESVFGKSLATDRVFGATYSQKTFHQMTVMLSTPACKFTPHIVRFVDITSGLTLVLISELGSGKQAGIIYQSLNVLRSLLSPRWVSDRAQAKYILDLMDNNIKKVQDLGKKAKGTSVERVAYEVARQWDQAKKQGVQAFLEQDSKDEMSPRLEGILSRTLDCLKELFRVLYLQPRTPGKDVERSIASGIERLQKRVQQQLSDYKDYLAVKALRNLTITRDPLGRWVTIVQLTHHYVEEFPGLVHFIHIDRLSNQLTAPSINVSEEKQDDRLLNMSQVVKEKVWDMVPRMQEKVQQGYLTQTLREGDFYFTYYLWFEDGSGSPLAPQQAYQGFHDNIQPGILVGNFYRSLCRQCFPRVSRDKMLPCFELITVHVGLVSSQFATGQCQKLATMLYEVSTASSAPIGLL